MKRDATVERGGVCSLIVVMGPDNGFKVKDLGGCNLRGIDQRQRTIGGLKDLIVANNRCPLERKTDITLLPFIETRMNTMFKIAGHRD